MNCSHLIKFFLFWATLQFSNASNNEGSSSLPRSKQHSIFPEHSQYPPWKASPNIDDDGFLLQQYNRLQGEWESEVKLRKGHQRDIQTPAIIRQVPGDGNCLFHSISTCYAHAMNGTHINLRDSKNLQWLYRHSASLRQKTVDCLEQKQKFLYVQDREFMRVDALVEEAALQHGICGTEYCKQMRQGGYWGGGPEILALCNVLKMPIYVYELLVKNDKFVLRRMACFGSPKFDRNQALHILSADSRFPDLKPGDQMPEGNHFMAMFPEQKGKKRRLRGGDHILDPDTIRQDETNYSFRLNLLEIVKRAYSKIAKS